MSYRLVVGLRGAKLRRRMICYLTTWLLASRGFLIGTSLWLLTGCTFYQSLLGYPRRPQSKDFNSYDAQFKAKNEQLLAKSNLSFTGFYYRPVVGTSRESLGYRYLKFRDDGSFFTAFMGVPPEQFALTEPVDDLGYIRLAGDTASYELKSATNHTGFTGKFIFYRDSLLMVEHPTRRSEKPNYLVYKRYMPK
ncbi:MAG: hypothetical protein EOO61_06205 [Hymenobacter sp.]|nr:MAG: hypothetical protein EOO61_06205 [Hymenobacter sp.]